MTILSNILYDNIRYVKQPYENYSIASESDNYGFCRRAYIIAVLPMLLYVPFYNLPICGDDTLLRPQTLPLLIHWG